MWRTVPFTVGSYYRVLKTFQSGLDTFEARVVLEFLGADYVRYDSSTMYAFKDPSGKQYNWWQHDLRPDEEWEELFEKTAPTCVH